MEFDVPNTSMDEESSIGYNLIYIVYTGIY